MEIKSLSGENSLLILKSRIKEISNKLKKPQENIYKNLKIASDSLGASLSNAVLKRLDTDKRMGVLLSGGNDSSLAVALIRKSYMGKLNTLFMTFEDNSRDYEQYALQRLLKSITQIIKLLN